MRRILLYGMLLAAAAAMAVSTRAEKAKETEKKPPAPYAHVVIFRMKKDAPKDAVEKAIADCHELLGKIPSVISISAGRPAAKATPNVPKMEYDFALLVLVENAAELKKYLENPWHIKFVDKHGPFFDREKLQVFDFTNQMK